MPRKVHKYQNAEDWSNNLIDTENRQRMTKVHQTLMLSRRTCRTVDKVKQSTSDNENRHEDIYRQSSRIERFKVIQGKQTKTKPDGQKSNGICLPVKLIGAVFKHTKLTRAKGTVFAPM